MPDPVQVRTPIVSTKGIIALSIVFVYCAMWAFVVAHAVTNTINTNEAISAISDFAGVIGTMSVIVVIVVQNFFRKTEAG